MACCQPELFNASVIVLGVTGCIVVVKNLGLKILTFPLVVIGGKGWMMGLCGSQIRGRGGVGLFDELLDEVDGLLLFGESGGELLWEMDGLNRGRIGLGLSRLSCFAQDSILEIDHEEECLSMTYYHHYLLSLCDAYIKKGKIDQLRL